jgi:UDP-N-acetylmuramoylalanine--D-glutamate ligase
MNIKDKEILVIGMARSGIGAAKLAYSQGAKVSVYDAKAFENLSSSAQEEIVSMKSKGIRFYLGEDVPVEKFNIVVVSPGVPLDIAIIQNAYKKEKTVIGELEFASTYCKAPIVAITGTNGKTTTTTLVGEIIKGANSQTYVVGNIGMAFSEQVCSIPSNGVAVAEVSSFQLETINTFHPKISAILNITPDHLNRHKTMENYIDAKCQIYKNQLEDEYIILNENDTYFEDIKERVKGKVITFNTEKMVACGAYVKNNIIYENIFGIENKICLVDKLKLMGKHNLENVLAAVAITRCFNIPIEIVAKTLEEFRGVEHRIEYIGTIKGVDYFNDSKATNTDSAIKALLAMKKPIRLIGGGMDKKCSFIDWIKLFEGRVQKIYIIGETKHQIKRECNESEYYNTELFDSLEEATQKAYYEAKEGECVLLSPACASWDMFESYEQRGNLFKEIISQLKG